LSFRKVILYFIVLISITSCGVKKTPSAPSSGTPSFHEQFQFDEEPDQNQKRKRRN
jgi:hypothetical protein